MNSNQNTSNYNSSQNKEKNSNSQSSSYKKVDDNDLWDCSGFFCIVIEFIMYEHKLLWWWAGMSIEALINRSNKHLQKFTNSSLVQAKMWINNFEIWLKDLNLPDIFHIWIQISTKPVPILSELNINNEEENDKNKWKFSKEDMLLDYYNSFSLEYTRKNDLNNYKKVDFHKKNIIDSANLSLEYISKNEKDLIRELERKKLMWEHTENAIDKMISYDEMNNYYDQFVQLGRFIESINEYSSSLQTIINWMNKIPIDG